MLNGTNRNFQNSRSRKDEEGTSSQNCQKQRGAPYGSGRIGIIRAERRESDRVSGRTRLISLLEKIKTLKVT
jgi:hypothetical protein